jgi:hypothetical protein
VCCLQAPTFDYLDGWDSVISLGSNAAALAEGAQVSAEVSAASGAVQVATIVIDQADYQYDGAEAFALQLQVCNHQYAITSGVFYPCTACDLFLVVRRYM